MKSEENNLDPEIPKLLIKSVQEIFEQKLQISFSREPEINEREIIEYQSRMRINGLEKFNAPCFICCASAYYSQLDIDQKDSAGSVLFYLFDETAGSMLRPFGERGADEDDIEVLKPKMIEFTNLVTNDLKKGLNSSGYNSLTFTEAEFHVSNIAEGVPFKFTEHEYFEINFFARKNKLLVIDITLAKP